MSTNKVSDKICGVCDQIAIGKNFGALTCGPCKAFFSRNAIKNTFECNFDGKCDISFVTQKFCPKCRLNKCVKIGMRKEWIIKDKDREVIKQKVAENRQKRLKISQSIDESLYNNSNDFTSDVSDITNKSIAKNDETFIFDNWFKESDSLDEWDQLDFNTTTTTTTTTNITTQDMSLDFDDLCNEFLFDQKVDGKHEDIYEIENSLLTSIDSKSIDNNNLDNNYFDLNLNSSEYLSKNISKNLIQYKRQNSFNDKNNNNFTIKITAPGGSETPEFGLTLDNNIKFDTNFDFDCIPLVYNPNTGDQSVVSVARPVTDYSNYFNETEAKCLTELLTALDTIKDPMPINVKDIETYGELYEAMAMKFDSMVRQIIKLSKYLSAFQCLDENDKQILIKNSCIEIILIQSAIYYDYDNGFWTIYMKNDESVRIKLDILKQNPVDVYSVCKQCLFKAKLDCCLDQIIFDLLTAIVLFDPNQPNLVNRDVVKFQQKIYLYLLKRYLSVRFQWECDVKYAKIMSLINDLHVWGQLHRKSGAQRDPNVWGPLLTEILDINKMTLNDQ